VNKVQLHISFFYEIAITLSEFLESYPELFGGGHAPYDFADFEGTVRFLDQDVKWFQAVSTNTIVEEKHSAFLNRMVDFPDRYDGYIHMPHDG
jgi:hypothetical protein